MVIREQLYLLSYSEEIHVIKCIFLNNDNRIDPNHLWLRYGGIYDGLKRDFITALYFPIQWAKFHQLTAHQHGSPYDNLYYNTRPTEKSPVRQQNAWFDRKKPGSTEKCPVRQKNALPRMHQLTLPLSNIPPPPYSEKYFFPIFFPYFFKNQ